MSIYKKPMRRLSINSSKLCQASNQIQSQVSTCKNSRQKIKINESLVSEKLKHLQGHSLMTLNDNSKLNEEKLERNCFFINSCQVLGTVVSDIESTLEIKPQKFHESQSALSVLEQNQLESSFSSLYERLKLISEELKLKDFTNEEIPEGNSAKQCFGRKSQKHEGHKDANSLIQQCLARNLKDCEQDQLYLFLNDLKNQNTEKDQIIAKLKTDIKEKQSNMIDLNSIVQNQKNDRQRLKEVYKALDTEVQELSKQKEEIEQKLTDLTEKFQQIYQINEQLNEELGKVTEQLTKSKQYVSELTKSAIDTESTISDLRLKIEGGDQNKQKLVQKEQVINALKHEVKLYKEQLSEQRVQNQQLTSLIENKLSRFQDLGQEQANMKNFKDHPQINVVDKTVLRELNRFAQNMQKLHTAQSFKGKQNLMSP